MGATRNTSRRDFLQRSRNVALSAMTFRAVRANSSDAGAAETTKRSSQANASTRLRIAVIGCGGQGRGGHMGGFPVDENAEIAYVCDPDESRLAKAANLVAEAKPIADFRRALDDPTVDGVTIATPDHWHVPAALLAMQAGKHVYIEKPCSHNLREGRLLVEAAAHTGRIVQHGTQARSTPGFQQAIEMLHGGAIGDVRIAKVWNVQKRENIGRCKPTAPPDKFDYDLWTGPAPKLPFQENRHHYHWHWWYNFGTGDIGNDGVHELDMARWGLQVNAHPNRVCAVGGKYVFDDDQQFPDTLTATFEYSGDRGEQKQLICEMRLWSTNYPEGVDNGVEFLGTEGKMFFSRRGKFQILGPRNQRVDANPVPSLKWNVADNLRTWLNAIRGKTTATADASEAHLSASLCHLANVGARVGRTLQVAPDEEAIVGDDVANQLLSRQYRAEHWATPNDNT